MRSDEFRALPHVTPEGAIREFWRFIGHPAVSQWEPEADFVVIHEGVEMTKAFLQTPFSRFDVSKRTKSRDSNKYLTA